MSLPEIGKWETVYIPKEYRRSIGIWPNHIIICPGPNKRGFEDSMRGFAEAMDAAVPIDKSDVVKGGCYAGRVADLGDGVGQKTWRRVVATGYQGAGRWRLFCGDLGIWNGEPASFKDLRFLPERYRAMPFQAILAELPVEPIDEELKKYPNEAFKFLADELNGATSLNICIGAITERPDSWPRVKMTLSSMMKEEKPDCIVRAMIKKKLAKRKQAQ